MDTRTCRKCGETKPLEDFEVNNEVQGWRRHECRRCVADRKLKWHNSHKERELQKMRERYATKGRTYRKQPEVAARIRATVKVRHARLRDAVYALLGNACACCDEREPMFLCLDHIGRDGKHYRQKEKSNHIGSALYFRILKGEFDGVFRLLCFSCNLGRERNGGVCPHQEGSTTRAQARTPEAYAGGSAQHPYFSTPRIWDDEIVCSPEKSGAVVH